MTTVIVGMIAFSFLKDRATSPHLFTAVDGSINTIASSSGFRIEEHRRGNASPRLAILDSLSNKVSGRPFYDDVDEYLLKSGSDTVRVTVHYSLGKVASVEILPIQMPSKQAEVFRTELTTAFPGLDCHIKGS